MMALLDCLCSNQTVDCRVQIAAATDLWNVGLYRHDFCKTRLDSLAPESLRSVTGIVDSTSGDLSSLFVGFLGIVEQPLDLSYPSDGISEIPHFVGVLLEMMIRSSTSFVLNHDFEMVHGVQPQVEMAECIISEPRKFSGRSPVDSMEINKSQLIGVGECRDSTRCVECSSLRFVTTLSLQPCSLIDLLFSLCTMQTLVRKIS